MELIRHKSYGPIAVLKQRFRKQMILIPVLLAMVIIGSRPNAEIFTNVMFWCYAAFCLSLSIYFYFNYRLVKNMECADCMVKANLEGQISTLEKRLKWHMVGVRVALVFFIVLTEVLPYFQSGRMLNKWHSIDPMIRLAAYAGLLLLQYFVSRVICKHKYGQHLAYLKELVNQME